MAEANREKTDNFDDEMPLFSEGFDKVSKTIAKEVTKKEEKKASENKMKTPVIITKKNKIQTKKNIEENTGQLGLTIGSYLQEARVKSDYSLSQVSMITKLNIHYIEAIERDDLESAPPFIYVKAYVKKLCDLYKIDENKALRLLESCKDNKTPDKVLPNTMLQDLEETKQVDEKEAKKIKYLARIISCSVAVVLIIIIIIFLSVGGGEEKHSSLPQNSQETQKIIQEKMEKLIVPQTLTPSELHISGEKN